MNRQHQASSSKHQESSDLTRKVLNGLPKTPLHVARNGSKADVWLAEWPQGSARRVVIKDFRRRPLFVKIMGGRYSLLREWRAMVALDDLPEVPKAVARPDSDAIVIEHRAGTPIKEFVRGDLAPGVLEKIEALLATMHRRGVTHGDLHGANILVDEQGVIALIDWATACFFGETPHGPKAASFGQWRALDERALAKLKLLHAPQRVTAHERHVLLKGPSAFYRFVKRLRFLFAVLRGKKPSREWMFAGAEVQRLLENEPEVLPGGRAATGFEEKS